MSNLEQSPAQARNLSVEKKTENAEYQSDHSDGHEAEKAMQPISSGNDTPDGGLVAWLVVLGAWCTSFCSFGWLNSATSLRRGPVVGTLYDHFGPRWLILIGSILHVFGIMMTSLGTEYYQILLAQGLCSAIGVSAIFQPAIGCIHGWFSRRRGAAFGILFTGSSLGGVIFPIIVSHLIREVGFGWVMRISAFLILVLLIIANMTVRVNHPPVPHKVTRARLLKPLTETDFLLLTAGFFCFSYGFFAPVYYLPLQALDAGMDPNLGQYVLPILNAGSLFGRLFSGFLGDKLGRYNIFIVVCYLSGGFWILALWLPDTNDPALIAFAALFGFFSGAYVSLIAPLVMQISPMAEIGFRTGIVLFVTPIGGLTTNPINGAILDNAGGWVGLKVFSGVLCIAGTTFVLVARIRLTGWKLFVPF
ncbi:uncharacterized protein Z518_05714 [Rhinocladiella mackenziei CBS 650.93]|uniref:Major facilitator superfamily (MFS) profile domain-containing protein n=1 Tax=Rhinocladiella mackenziei CBS 650.93 TaxID=1442369 RepID=A0A0D2H334_9EURO|nr:uncharacterized protein Z518_05714 [Rhinocladiella mackenziei CBS 650.93]KIX04843.1 hypothetical protein Z518_05714 [Rhinocladiella mackenziei CBS 650.93]